MAAYDNSATLTQQLQETFVNVDSLPETDAPETCPDATAMIAAEFAAEAVPQGNSHLHGTALKAYGRHTAGRPARTAKTK